MSRITLHDKEFELHIPQDRIERSIVRIAAEIDRDMAGAHPLFVVVLNGAFMFAAELLKRVGMACDISFIKLSSYCGTRPASSVRELIGLDHAVAGRTVVLVEDVIDTGRTMHGAQETLRQLGAGRVKIATLLFKPDAFRRDFPVHYIGMEIPNDFIVGYGLDYRGQGRNLPDIYKLAGEARTPMTCIP